MNKKPIEWGYYNPEHNETEFRKHATEKLQSEVIPALVKKERGTKRALKLLHFFSTNRDSIVLDKTWNDQFIETVTNNPKLLLRGQFRDVGADVSLGGLFSRSGMAIKGEDVRESMRIFCDKTDQLYPELMEQPDEIKRKEALYYFVSWSYLTFLKIHPFIEGNGRVSRAFVNYLLARGHESQKEFPLDEEGRLDRKSSLLAYFGGYSSGLDAVADKKVVGDDIAAIQEELAQILQHQIQSLSLADIQQDLWVKRTAGYLQNLPNIEKRS